MRLPSGNLNALDNRHDLVGQEIEQFQIGYLGRVEYGLIDAYGREVPEILNGGGRREAVVAAIPGDSQGIESGLLNVRIGAAKCFAMLAQDVKLALHLFLSQAHEKIARVTILSHHTKGLALSSAANQNRRVGFCTDAGTFKGRSSW